MELVFSLIGLLILAVGFLGSAFTKERAVKERVMDENKRLRAQNANLMARERDAINVLMEMRQKGFEGRPVKDPDAEDLESWAIDNEYEVEVERNRGGLPPMNEKEKEDRPLDLPPGRGKRKSK